MIAVKVAIVDAFKHLNSIDDRKMAVSCSCFLVGFPDMHMAQLEHVVAFLSQHADGPLKGKVAEVQDKLVQLRSSLLLYAPFF
jgi:hypothetical protein